MRITLSMLNNLCDYLNKITGNPDTPYKRDEERYRAQIGNYNISQQNGRVCLHQIMNEGGGVNAPIVNCHCPKAELWGMMQAYISGVVAEKRAHS
jgi:hypothetical protein